ncbi:MAG: hypothetical protein A3C30_03940 [Candidatus Levybacteria bacterium RIFCSPHIGHO2_02_FULL_40_18]|nr:MAG: hypothetical protein A2869_00560 [Candidatus Levybacteria bacterium RIFCSPHIGHO2_01_FULL_40_58]OGH26235.1 MAG: hypothetical protein A3C30_03940 [Candidatus Levybacteria bacterium RIFCSPHIGHO2_02_FULL_40_18]OGH31487.1 MAG: hypothetical protein A3E43_02980 [Candidatus Levybacteria bacterium RIFCSPHIGHO2_12_FULL_40_31]OGH40127.1 MAG: hypothetical protein A2894_04300 [Candidatus Levybacteria bacterium RIFCSPLOWO2_01_FULL_40_64]OGH49080.1 MAG: hypothetical protein A3I54_00725 [Candidatus Lev
MDQNILLSKVVANPTDTTWAQAYSTLNLYIVLSIRSEDAEAGIVTSGKELLEKIQREYFSLDDKNITNIKGALDKSLEGINKNSISIVLATVKDNVLYLVIANEGEIILKRDGKIGVIARGDADNIVAYSGNIKSDDIVVLETGGFSKKVPLNKLSGILDDREVSEISEHLAPLIHEKSEGSEAAIVLTYKGIEEPASRETQGPAPQEDESIEELGHEREGGKIRLPQIKIPTISLDLFNVGKKRLIILGIILLSLLLIVSVLFERQRQESASRRELLAEILTPAQEKFDEAEALISLNKGLALEEFDTLKTTLEESRDKFASNTSERKKLDEFIGKVESKIGELGAGATIANQKVVFENVDLVIVRDGALVATREDGKIALLSKDGESEKEIDSENKDVKAIAANKDSVFLLGTEGITRTTKSSGQTQTIVEDPDTTVALDTFGSSLYGLSTSNKTVDKYSGSSFARSDYFTEDITLSNPASMSIDASIWIIDGGKVRKFTRGKEDTFTISGLAKNLSSDSLIFTDVDYDNIYILDRTNARIISISKTGELKNQYSWKDLSKASSLAIDEESETAYVVTGNKLYSFDL